MRILGKRGISPLIATIILIAICIAGGALVYSIFFSTTGTLTAKGQVTVESIDLVKPTTGDAVFTITLKNSGNKPVTKLNVTLAEEPEASVDLPGGILQPGQSTFYMNDTLNATKYVVGNGYIVVIRAAFSDGSTFAETTSVRCRSG